MTLAKNKGGKRTMQAFKKNFSTAFGYLSRPLVYFFSGTHFALLFLSQNSLYNMLILHQWIFFLFITVDNINLPIDTRNLRMAPSPDSNSAILTRGTTVLELNCSTSRNCSWQSFKNMELKISRNSHLLLSIPSNFVDACTP